MSRKSSVAAVALAVALAICCAVAVATAAAQGPGPPTVSGEQTEGAGPAFTTMIQDWVAVAGGAVAVIAAIVGGFLAWRNAQIFRAKAPHVVVEHEVSHRPVGTQYVHIFVTAVLHNKSRVHVEFLDGFASIRQVKPISDTDVEVLYQQVFSLKEYDNFEWPDLDLLRHRWEEDGLLVEPGETETEVFDFVVQRDVESVAITTYFYNARVVGKLPTDLELDAVQRRKRRFRRWLRERGALGWGHTTVYDIIRPE